MLLRDFLTQENWIKQNSARTLDGRLCDPTLEEAHFFCLFGGMCKIYPRSKHIFTVVYSASDPEKIKLISEIIEQLYPQFKRVQNGLINTNIIDFNDSVDTTWNDIKKVLNTANI